MGYAVTTTGTFDASAATGNYLILTGHADQINLWCSANTYGYFAWSTGDVGTAITSACPRFSTGIVTRMTQYMFPGHGGPKYLIWNCTAASGYMVQELFN